MNMIRKGQIQGIDKGNVRAQVEFVSQVQGLPNKKQGLRRIACPQLVWLYRLIMLN